MKTKICTDFANNFGRSDRPSILKSSKPHNTFVFEYDILSVH